MNLNSKKILANRVRLLRQRLERENEKIISDVFLSFHKEIEQQINKSDEIKIDFTNHLRNMRRAINNMFIKSSNRTVEWCKTLFGWKLEGSAINRITNNSLNLYNKNMAANKVNAGETTKEIINSIISKGQAAGKNYKDIAKDISDSIQEMSISRARTIALTETANAVNITTHETALEAEMRKKTWLHVGGGFEDRESHLRLDGVSINIDEYFNISGFKALYPHDPSLPAKEIINCHCIAIYE